MLEDTVRRYYAAVDANNIPLLLSFFHDDVEYRRPGYPPMRGRSQLREFYIGTRVIAEGRHTLVDVVAAGECVAVRGTFRGRAKDDRPLHLDFADFFRGGRTIRVRQTYFYVPMV